MTNSIFKSHILRHFDVLPNFLFTTSKTFPIITYAYGIYQLKLGNTGKSGGRGAHTR